jgi:hypothetical protein
MAEQPATTITTMVRVGVPSMTVMIMITTTVKSASWLIPLSALRLEKWQSKI